MRNHTHAAYTSDMEKWEGGTGLNFPVLQNSQDGAVLRDGEVKIRELGYNNLYIMYIL